MTDLTTMDDLTLEAIVADPLPLLGEWLKVAEARSGQPNWNTMFLATVGPGGGPTVRAILLKAFDRERGTLRFFTNAHSPKARDIERDPRVALALHWDRLERQVRIEGRADPVAAEISDAYFATRPRDHQIGAWASAQSEPLEDWETLLGRVVETGLRFRNGPVPRPPHWGGFDVTPEVIEFWQGGEGRIHQRVRYRRREGSGWKGTWLYP